MHQLIQFMKIRGYKYSQDSLGMYFTSSQKKISLMNCGPAKNCFVNVLVNGQWILKNKQMNIINHDLLANFVRTNS